MRMKKGFSLIEIIIALGISFLLLLVLYKAYFLSTTFFAMGVGTIQEQTYLRKVFADFDEKFRYLNRFTSIGGDAETVEFEIFNTEVLEEDKNTNDKKVRGNVVKFSTREEKDATGTAYKILLKNITVYEWWMKFGHSQVPVETVEPPGYPEDMLNPITGKTVTETGEAVDMLDQDASMPFLLTSIKYIPYDKDGLVIESSENFDYSVLKNARSIKIELEYVMKGEFGDAVGRLNRKKSASTNIPFIGLASDRQ